MFKSKIDFNAFDTNNEKVTNLEQPKVRALSKASVKKLAAQPGEKSNFHLILDYFKDDKEKPLGHFLAFGIHKKLDKHFEQVEMKSGKKDKRMSPSQKDASMGQVYVKDENGKKLLCFEPSPSSKIPNGKWPKILKALKPYLSGLKAVIAIAGVLIDEDSPETDGDTKDSASQNSDSQSSNGLSDDESSNASDSDQSNDGEGSKQLKKLENAFEQIKTNLASWKSEKDSKKKINMIKPLLKKVEKLVDYIDQFIGSGNASDADQKTATTIKNNLDKYKASLSKMDANVHEKKGEVTRKNMDSLFSEIKTQASSIKGDHADELSNFGGSEDIINILDEILA